MKLRDDCPVDGRVSLFRLFNRPLAACRSRPDLVTVALAVTDERLRVSLVCC